MVLERYRDASVSYFDPVARALGRVGFTPNAVTAASLFFAIAAGVAFAYSGPARPELLVAGSALVALNAILDAVDGRLARLTDTASKRGDYLDHVVDRYSDAAILVGLTFSPWVDVRIGVLALVGTFLTSYMGTQAQALGLGRNYGGFLGRADRLVLLIAVPVLEAARVYFGYAAPYGVTLVALVLAYFAIVGNVTAVQRFWQGWKSLS